jgi:hypothetical protein
MIPGSASPLLLATAAAGGYSISRSVRFNSSDSAYCGRNFTSAGNQKKWTWAGWVKRSTLSSGYQTLFSAGSGGGRLLFGFGSGDTFSFELQGVGSHATTAVFRDPSAWYHVVVAFDTTQATAADRTKVWINNTLQALSGLTFSQNTDYAINSSVDHRIGCQTSSVADFFNGYLADVHFIDGQALDPSSFTEVSATTGQLIPKAYTGSFGTNGFWLKFSDNSAATATTLGKDYSPNGNNWTPNNLSVTAGAGNDSLVDTPTSYGTDTGAGGEVRGNYATLNPLDNISADGQCTLSNGNLDVNTGTGAKRVTGTQAFASGKWYWECTFNGTGGARTGIQVTAPDSNHPEQSEFVLSTIGGAGLYTIVNGSFTQVSSAVTVTTGQVVGIGIDADSNISYWYVDGVLKATYDFSSLIPVGSRSLVPIIWNGSGDSLSWSMNFGQRAFAYQTVGSNRPAATYKALCDTNLPAPVVTKPSTVMDVKLYTGNGSTQTISGLEFSPDLVWCKRRSGNNFHSLSDTVRGATKDLLSDSTAAEITEANGLTAFTSTGFTLGSDARRNANLESFVAWTWDAGSSTVTNTQGSITTSCRTNASAGFSIVGYTGTGSSGTLGHGLNVKPQLIIVKSRTQARDWLVYHTSYGATQYTTLNGTGAAAATSSAWNNTEPTSTVFTIGNAAEINTNGSTNIAYCFAPVAGYSSAFSFTGNGSTDGPMCYLGFRPRLILLKRTDSTGDWLMVDTSRSPYNLATTYLYANGSFSEMTYNLFDILSNGFKLRDNFASWNASGGTYVGFAWAESPFNYSRAR